MSAVGVSGEGRTVGGLLVPYGVWSEVDSAIEGNFLERWMFGALRKSIVERLRERVRGFFEHKRSRLFGSAPVMDLRRVWEEEGGAFYEAELLDGLPGFFLDGLRKGLYGSSIGAKPVEVDTVRNPKRSAHNPSGLEERTYREVDLFDISIVAQPHYAGTTVALRALPTARPGMIYRSAPLVVAPAWALEPPAVRDYLADIDYLADPEPVDYLTADVTL
jgi:hypothetical protein